MIVRKNYQPPYFGSFKCAGRGCRHNCCCGWEIQVDNESYEYYKSLDDEALRRRLLDNIEFSDGESAYAKIKLDENIRCPFNTPEGLCELQPILGHEHLPEICRSFPRVFRAVSVETESFLTMSCEVAAESALFNTDILALVEAGDGPGENYRINGSVSPSGYTKAENGSEIFWELRIAVVSIIQHRRYPVWLRLVILGFFIKDADELIQDGKEEGIAGLARTFASRIETGLYDGYLKDIPHKPQLKIAFIYGLLDKMEKADNARLRLLNECISEMREGLGLAGGEVSPAEAVKTFYSVYENFYAPFSKDLEYIFENYIANTVYMTGFPFVYGREGRLYDNYLRLVVKYALVKFLLIGMAGYYKQNFNKDAVLKGIVSFSRTFDHGPKMVDSIAEYLKENDAATAGALCVLIKD